MSLTYKVIPELFILTDYGHWILSFMYIIYQRMTRTLPH
ncbi:hypothetical protein ACUXFU_002696 [Staphylococcus saprophyticus]